MGDALQRPDQVRALEVLGLVRPHVLQDLGDVEIAELVDDIAHEARLADCPLHLIEPRRHDVLAAHDAGYGARNPTQHVVPRVHGLFARRERVGQALHRVEARVDQGHRDHPDAVLDARGEHGDLGEQALVRGTGEHAALRPLRTHVGAHDHDGGAEEFDKMPALSRDGEQIQIVADIAEDLQRGVVLKE